MMIDKLKLLGATERSIIVETRKGTKITNLIEVEPGFQQHQFYRALLKKYEGKWDQRKPATGVYNCAGHVWASRRTALLNPDEWRIILKEDDYRLLVEPEVPVPDDLAVYVDEENGEILHVGRILQMEEGVAPGARRIPRVVSKWNSTSGEVVHLVYDVPYGSQGFSFRVEYWTDRPIQ